MNRTILFIAIFYSISLNGFSQKTEDPYQKKYEWRIRQEVLYGVYIPRDVNDALIQLTRLTDEESKAKLKNMAEEEVVKKLYFSFGRWMSHNWGFHEGSRLTVYFQKMGIYAPDDMTRFMMILFHRNLTKKPLDIKELVLQIQENAERKKQERQNKGTILHEEIRQRERPTDIKNGGQ